MRLKALALALAVAGFGASYAFAKGNPGHGHQGTTTAHGSKLAVCHKAGKSGRWVKIVVASKAAQKAHLKHGDVLPDASGHCPGTTSTTTESTTTASTTTDETTTEATTTEDTTTTEQTTTDDQGDDSGSHADGHSKS